MSRLFVLGFLLCSLLAFGQNAMALEQKTGFAKAWEAYNIGHYKEAVAILNPLAVNGDASAQTLLGQCYESGLGVPQNLATAVEWYQLAAEQNYAHAQVLLAYCYQHGLGVSKDGAKTLELMTKAAKAGFAEAEFNLALYYSKGQFGLAKNYQESFAWAQKAASQGYAQAERYLGACYEYGVGTEKNEQLAQSWYAKAKAKGLAKEGNIFMSVHSLP